MATRKVIPLNRTWKYPCYQSHLKIRYAGHTADEAARRVILTVYQWLRERIGDNIPQGLNLPGPEECDSVSDDQIVSFYYKNGFSIHVTSMLDLGMWALSVSEFDRGIDDRPGVPGRTIVTNIALKYADEEWVGLGLRTDTYDPIGIEELSYSYRPAIVRTMLKDESLELTQGSPVIYKEARMIRNGTDLEAMKQDLRDRTCTMPAVVFTYAEVEANIGLVADAMDRQLGLCGKEDSFSARLTGMGADVAVMPVAQPVMYYHYTDMADTMFAYARTYVLEPSYADTFFRWCGLEKMKGEIVFLEPEVFGGKKELIYPEDRTSGAQRIQLYEELKKRIFSYTKHRVIDFDGILFEPRLRTLESDAKIHRLQSSVKKATTEELEALFTEMNDELKKKDDEIRKLNARIDSLEAREQSRRANEKTGLSFNMPETTEAYEHEIHDLIISVLTKARDSQSYAEDGCRAADLLKEFLEKNPMDGQGKKIFEEVKRIFFGDKNLNQSMLSKLEGLGFSWTVQGNEHYRITLKNDEKHYTTVSCTGSENRGCKNAYSQLQRMMSVYRSIQSDDETD